MWLGLAQIYAYCSSARAFASMQEYKHTTTYTAKFKSIKVLHKALTMSEHILRPSHIQNPPPPLVLW